MAGYPHRPEDLLFILRIKSSVVTSIGLALFQQSGFCHSPWIFLEVDIDETKLGTRRNYQPNSPRKPWEYFTKGQDLDQIQVYSFSLKIKNNPRECDLLAEEGITSNLAFFFFFEFSHRQKNINTH